MSRRKKILVALAGVLAFGIGFLSTLRSAPAQERFDPNQPSQVVIELSR